MVRQITLGWIVTVSIIASATAKGESEEDLAADILGDWDIVGMVHRGEVSGPDHVIHYTLRIEKDKWIVKPKDYDARGIEFNWRIKAGKGSGDFDLIGKTGVHLARYELKDGVLKIIVARSEKPRPADFDAEKNADVTLYILSKPKK